MKPGFLHLGCAFVLSLFSQVVRCEDVHVAVASNFSAPAREIADLFMKEKKHQIHLSSGASGKFFTQISNGAPFDVLLSADQEHPRKLIKNNLAESETLMTYAQGKLVLWSSRPGYVDAEGKVLSSSKFRHLSIANPDLAPYGMAAKECLEKLGLWKSLQNRIVKGENIAQTHQFAASGNAELGFVAFSQIYVNEKISSGSFWMVPQKLYSVLKQDAVLLRRGKDNAAAKDFLKFLASPDAHAIMKRFGYDLP